MITLRHMKTLTNLVKYLLLFFVNVTEFTVVTSIAIMLGLLSPFFIMPIACLFNKTPYLKEITYLGLTFGLIYCVVKWILNRFLSLTKLIKSL